MSRVVMLTVADDGTTVLTPLSEGGTGTLADKPFFVADDFAGGEILEDQTGADDVLTFTFSAAVAGFWVAGVHLVNGEPQEAILKVNHYGGAPSATAGIPVFANVGGFPIPEPAQAVKVYAPAGVSVTVWGQRRA